MLSKVSFWGQLYIFHIKTILKNLLEKKEFTGLSKESQILLEMALLNRVLEREELTLGSDFHKDQERHTDIEGRFTQVNGKPCFEKEEIHTL